eukprot:CAMPEP_0204111774 /NCGR_PEP_ID=MMETSP0361-20130328/2663_1 /ASSEMBLY_ACC=CAM_ASM_000343 /TAXON_ID=268821 /ORGANISM="Scrippsiella Hangoei, Strain SHTV-5" /LENGTH=79 /DNA_ID=CAMNT_0051061871 /DNA_START=213 /DNA_END=448 /DNA_ORIENTATION=-
MARCIDLQRTSHVVDGVNATAGDHSCLGHTAAYSRHLRVNSGCQDATQPQSRMWCARKHLNIVALCAAALVLPNKSVSS